MWAHGARASGEVFPQNNKKYPNFYRWEWLKRLLIAQVFSYGFQALLQCSRFAPNFIQPAQKGFGPRRLFPTKRLYFRPKKLGFPRRSSDSLTIFGAIVNFIGWLVDDLSCCQRTMLTRQDGLGKEVVDEIAESMVPMLLSSNESKRQSVVMALTDLNVDLNIIVETLLSILEDIAPTQVGSHAVW